MAYVPVPKDLTKVKTKVAFNLTKRQLVCFGGGALIGVPLFFLLREPVGNSVAAMCMMLVMLPFFMQSIATESDIIMAIWSCVGYTVLLCFTLFKTGSLAKSVFNAH